MRKNHIGLSFLACILCSPDASEIFGAGGGALLDTDTSTINTDFPILAQDTYQLKVDKSEIKQTEKGGWCWNLELSTTERAKSKTGEDLAPGVKVFHRTMLTPTEKMSLELVGRNVASVTQAADMGNVKLGEIGSWHMQIMGKTLMAKVVIEPERTDKVTNKTYDERHSVKLFIKK